MKSKFAESLLAWHSENPRPMPWSGERDPYKIWLSEIILQQTRVEQGLPYYIAFTQNYPTVTDLANAELDAVLLLWQGLGYYSRARNLHIAAQAIRDNYKGIFPTDYQAIRAIKGVGDYTAAAIASFAYNLPYAVVDGNVYRVLARVFGIYTPQDMTEGKKEFSQLAQSLLPKDSVSTYNQAIMNFGATQCTPKQPKCSTCPFIANCEAYKNNAIAVLPVKIKKMALRTRFFNFLVIADNDCFWITQRNEKDIWQGLYQFPMIETERVVTYFSDLVSLQQYEKVLGESQTALDTTFTATQLLTHQRIEATFWTLKSNEVPNLNKNNDFLLVEQKKIANFAFPRIISVFLEQFNIGNKKIILQLPFDKQ